MAGFEVAINGRFWVAPEDREELADDWQRARQELPLRRIEPLE